VTFITYSIHHFMYQYTIYRVSQNYVNTDLKDRIRTVVSSVPRDVCPGFKWYCCSLVIVC